MTTIVDLILFLVALVCFGLAAFGAAVRFNLIALGLLFFTLPFFLAALDAHA